MKRKKQTRKSLFADKFAGPISEAKPEVEAKPETKQDDAFTISEGMKHLFGITPEK